MQLQVKMTNDLKVTYSYLELISGKICEYTYLFINK